MAITILSKDIGPQTPEPMKALYKLQNTRRCLKEKIVTVKPDGESKYLEKVSEQQLIIRYGMLTKSSHFWQKNMPS